MDEASFWLVLILIHTVLLSLFVASSGLQVFQKEAHPSVYKAGGGGVKEGLSLFGINCIIKISFSLFFIGIANKTKSALGYKMLK